MIDIIISMMLACGETDSIIHLYWGYWTEESGANDHVIICFYDKNTRMIKIYCGIKNDINGKDWNIWSLNNQLIFEISGELDETGFELNPVLCLYTLKSK